MIEFLAENVNLPELPYHEVEQWIKIVAARHGRKLGNLCYCFCDDDYIIRANREFLGHDYYTDIITFQNNLGSRIGGDILISLDTVASNAQLLGEAPGRELMRVIIHGVLHLCGINDKGPGERDIMESHENDALSLLPLSIKNILESSFKIE